LGVQATTFAESGKAGPLQFTSSGVTVMGDAVKVPVATNCACPFCAVTDEGLMEIDWSIRLELLLPQLRATTAVNPMRLARTRRFIWHLWKKAGPIDILKQKHRWVCRVESTDNRNWWSCSLTPLPKAAENAEKSKI
jgi:hypothetical protein